MDRLYRRQAPVYDATRRCVLFGRRHLANSLALMAGERVLDIGCGTGALLPEFAARVGAGGRVVGVDCTAAMARRARQRTAADDHVEVVHAPFAHSGLAPGSFDVAVFSYALTLMPDWRESCELARALLTPGGRIGVVDFVDARTPARQAFEAHAIEFGPERRAWLAKHTAPRVDEVRRAYLGLWRYFVWVGVAGQSR